MLNDVRVAIVVLAVWAAGAGAAIAQESPPRDPPGEPAGRADEFSVRFTPGMARAMGHLFADDVLRKRYDLPLERKDEAAEAVARHLLKAAHGSQEQARDLVEFYMGEAMELVANMREGESMHGVPRQFGTGFGQRVLPLLPAVRELIRDVGQDVRPMLPMKGQLKFGTDLMAVKAGMDAFEENMQRWSEGNVDPMGNPFEKRDKPVEVDASGRSETLNKAMEQAERGLNDEARTERWRNYVDKAKKLYEFDEPQCATADSILDELTGRAKTAVDAPSRRDRAYRSRLWRAMQHHLPMGWGSPMRYFIERQQEEADEPLEVIEDELKRRIDRIPTQMQRRRADEKIMATLTEQGLRELAGPAE